MKQLEKLSGCPDSEHDLGLFLNSERDILVKSGPMTEKISCMLQLAKLNRALDSKCANKRKKYNYIITLTIHQILPFEMQISNFCALRTT